MVRYTPDTYISICVFDSLFNANPLVKTHKNGVSFSVIFFFVNHLIFDDTQYIITYTLCINALRFGKEVSYRVMKQKTTTYHTAHIWERGHRQINEDSLAIMDVVSGSKHILLAVVADGIGGLSEGEYASGYVTGRLRSSFMDYLQNSSAVTLSGLARLFLRALYNCHHYLKNYGTRHAIHTGTTVSILCLIGRRGIALHVGDSHLYRIGHRIRQLGYDHVDPRGHLTECIGSGNYRRKSIIKFKINKCETAILCTDGFYRIGEDLLERFALNDHGKSKLSSSELSLCLSQIKDYAYGHGEHDNMSAIAVRCS